LCEYLIKTYTSEGDLVLDNTAGSGTTAIACLNTNRQFIVMEKEQKYYDIILKRVGDFNKKFETQTLFGNEM
jgi:site-specific DNA-methyltransferase (adenine-specific)